jgi:hypothetical protein
MKNDIPFNVLRNPNSWDNVPRDPISVAIATAVTGATSGIAYWAVYAVSTIAISAVTSSVLSALSPKPEFPSSEVNTSQGLLVNGRGAAQPQDFVYGEVRKGGTITFIESTGSNNRILHQIIVLAGHEIEDVVDIYFNDEIVTMSNENVTTSPYSGYAKVYAHLGDQTSATSTFDNSTQSLATTLHAETSATSGFVGKGIAYLYCRFIYNQDAFANGIPTVTARIKGKKIVTTSSGTEQSSAYTNNAAWCIRDYLTSVYGLDDDAIDYSTFEAAADICDDHLDGTSIDQYTINGVIRSDQSHGQVLQQMMTACGGTLYWGGGSWRLYVGNFVTPTKTLTLADFRGPISLDTRVSMRDNFNTVRGTYIDASDDGDFITADYPSQTSSAFLTEDNNIETVLDLPLPFTTNEKAAQRLAKQMLYRSREQMTIQADFGMNAFNIEVGDFIKLQNARYGWGSGDEKTFECVGWRLQADQDSGELKVNLTLRESSSAAFGWTDADAQTIVRNNSTLPKYYEVPAIGLEISQEYRVVNENVTNAIVIDVTCDNAPEIDYVIVKYKKTSDTNFKSLGQGLLLDGNSYVARFEVNDIETPQLGETAINYTISATPVNGLGFKGTTVTTTFNVTADTTAPSAPASLSHFLSGGTTFFTWPAVSDLDLSHYKLYYTSNTSHTFPNNKASMDVKVAKIARPATSITWGALSGKWFVSAVDKTGNESTTAATTTISASELPSLNTSDTDTEHSGFDGDKTDNITDTGSAIHLTSYSSSGSDGVYEFYHDGDGYMDAGTSRTIRLSYVSTYTRKHANAVSGEINWDDIPNNWDSWPSDWDDWTDETLDYGDIDVQVQAASSTDNVTYSDYIDASGEIVGQYVKFRAVLSNSGANVTPLITALSATLEY